MKMRVVGLALVCASSTGASAAERGSGAEEAARLRRAVTGGQILYVAPRKDVVIAHFGTNAALDSPPPALPLSKMIDDLFPAR